MNNRKSTFLSTPPDFEEFSPILNLHSRTLKLGSTVGPIDSTRNVRGSQLILPLMMPRCLLVSSLFVRSAQPP
jgi:hypothetical protein